MLNIPFRLTEMFPAFFSAHPFCQIYPATSATDDIITFIESSKKTILKELDSIYEKN